MSDPQSDWSVVVNKMNGPLRDNRRSGMQLKPLHPVEEVRQRMTSGMPIGMKAREIGMGLDNYGFIQKLLTLLCDPLPDNERQRIEIALGLIDRDRAITRQTRELLRDILIKYKNRNKYRYYKVEASVPTTREHSPKAPRENSFRIKKRQRGFDLMLMHIREGCECANDIEIPRNLPLHERDEVVVTLASSVEHINKLIRRLMGEKEKDNDPSQV